MQLVYLLAFGAECLEQFKFCLLGLKKCRTDIALITDQQFEDPRVQVYHADSIEHPRQAYIFRTKFQNFIDIKNYDRVWYMDCDFLIFRDIIEKYKDSEFILLSNEAKWTMGNENFCGDLSVNEWNEYKNLPAINAGIYSVPKKFYSFFDLYNDAVQRIVELQPQLNIPEQMALNGIFARNQGDFKLFDPWDVGFPEKGITGAENAYHFACYKFHDKLNLMRKRWYERN